MEANEIVEKLIWFVDNHNIVENKESIEVTVNLSNRFVIRFGRVEIDGFIASIHVFKETSEFEMLVGNGTEHISTDDYGILENLLFENEEFKNTLDEFLEMLELSYEERQGIQYNY